MLFLTILTLNEVLNQWLGHILKQLLLGCLNSKNLFERVLSLENKISFFVSRECECIVYTKHNYFMYIFRLRLFIKLNMFYAFSVIT